MNPALIQEIAIRYTPHPCGKTARATKYGVPYTLICQQAKHSTGDCRDIDNGIWFEPGTKEHR